MNKIERMDKAFYDHGLDDLVDTYVKPVYKKIAVSMRWMIADLDFKNKNSECHIEDSEPLKEAKEILKQLEGKE